MIDIASFDIDGVIFMGGYPGVHPGPFDVIITGRSYEEEPETLSMLRSKGIGNHVIFNPIPYDEKTRETSGIHKSHAINDWNSLSEDYRIVIAYEDDPIQAKIIEESCPNIQVVLLSHNLVNKENERHLTW